MVKHGNHEYLCSEEKRLKEDKERKKYWKKWGPYLSERQWGTVREDYSANGDAWEHFSFDQAKSRTYRWGEDGIAGVSDNHALQCMSFAFWNEKDDILKERLFGLGNPEGNHGESVKEIHYYLDNTPTHSYMKYLYKYPQKKFPYEEIRKENKARSRDVPEYNIIDTGIFNEDRYWDIFIETAKDTDDEEEILFRVTAYNRGPEAAPLHIIPQVTFRNTWVWGHQTPDKKPSVEYDSEFVAKTNHWKLGERFIQLSPSPGVTPDSSDVIPKQLFTDNDTNLHGLYGVKNKSEYVKDGFHRYIIDDEKDAVNPARKGTKAAAWYAFDEGDGVPPGGCAVVRFKLSKRVETRSFIDERGKTQTENGIDEEVFDDMFELRRYEADEFYYRISPLPMTDDLRNIQRQAFSGMLWTKQFYHMIWEQWANGDPKQPPPPPERKKIRNDKWRHMYLDDILSMPDCWEYPFFAAWDTAFHCIPLAMIDPEFAKKQLDVLTREWYMHPNGQIPAYEWNYGDVNPPVHAWATFRIFKIERKMYGREDLDFLERVFQKLLLNFTWWVNRKDSEGKNVFEGGFLGLDNIGVFNRSEALPTGGVLEQADSTGWMAFYSLNMLNIALELAKHRRTYEDIASKFFEHFLFISDAMTYRDGDKENSLWNEDDGFYYDAISHGGPTSQQMPVKSLVGLIPLFAVLTLEPEVLKKFPSFTKRMDWFIDNRTDVAERNIASMKRRGKGDRLLLALVSRDKLKRILEKMLDEDEFLSPYGIRSLSKYHEKHPYSMTVDGVEFKVDYVPGDSNSSIFGGNSNWRGPIWLCVNFLLIESLLRFHMFYGNKFKVECPTGSGDVMHLGQVAEELQHRLQHIFQRDDYGRRACNAGSDMLDHDPNWRDHVFFHEFFHGDDGNGLGASHQTGWTGLIAKMIHDSGVNCRLPHTPRTPGAAANHYFDDIFSRVPKKPQPFLGRRHSTRSIDARSDWDDEDEEDRKAREKDDEEVLEYVNHRLKRVMSISGASAVGDPAADEDVDAEEQLDEA
ncbi:Six-hairpin glycosidase-like protein [Trichophaea hybrida]|nr:Six-hairpin glycosidase-like protein [Trichophaea hybrida]